MGRTGWWSAGTSWCVLSCELLSPTVTQKEVMFKGSPLFFHPLSNAPLSLGPKESSLLQPSSIHGKSVPCSSSTNSAPCCKAGWRKILGRVITSLLLVKVRAHKEILEEDLMLCWEQ